MMKCKTQAWWSVALREGANGAHQVCMWSEMELLDLDHVWTMFGLLYSGNNYPVYFRSINDDRLHIKSW